MTKWKTLEGIWRLYADDGASVFTVTKTETGAWSAFDGDRCIGTRNARGTAMRLCENVHASGERAKRRGIAEARAALLRDMLHMVTKANGWTDVDMGVADRWLAEIEKEG